MKSFFKKLNTGSITLELLIAFLILIVNITAVMLIINESQSLTQNNNTRTEAIAKAETIIEKSKAISRLDFNLVNSKSYFDDIFFQQDLIVDQLDIFTKKIISHVGWKDSRNLKHQIKFASILTNPKAIDGGDTCSSILDNPEGWKQPLYYKFSSVDFSGTNSNGIKIASIDVYNHKLYIGALRTQSSNNDTFFILNLPDEPNLIPILLGGLDNNNNSIVGLNAIKITKNYAYIANAYTGSSANCLPNNNCAQLQVVDIGDSLNPQIIPSANLKIPTITTSGKLAPGTSIFYDGGYVYLGLAKALNGNEFNIIDVGGGGLPASPTNPILKGGYVIGNGINSILVRDNLAFIASPNNENLIILDISNPESPSKVGGYTPINLPETNGVGSNHGKRLSLIGTTLYLGRTYGTKEFYILDVTNPDNPTVIDSPLDTGEKNKTSINGLIVRDYLTYILTPEQFQVWNISNPEDIKPWTIDEEIGSFIPTIDLGGNGISIDCEGNRIYLTTSPSSVNEKDFLNILISNL